MASLSFNQANSDSVCELTPKISKFFSDSSNYQSKIQQLISFSFTSYNFIFITCILSISKLCTAAATDPTQSGASTAVPSPNTGFVIPNISGSALLEKLNSLRASTSGPAMDKSKNSSPHAGNSIIDNTGLNSFFGGKGFMSMDFTFLNISGKIGTPLSIGKSTLNAWF
ncbi:uncharacterized protein LOC119675442 [Teleopsis dalmanni]|uniref:uncharacterized protein LOC119675442 n=1 Tax=Teleopsis dalmanni TaxID=139649 RepID=UPI0018CE41F9|nr:uncharacterized protein LOC119675442 [Teleopsis dalmanni]